MHEFVRLAKDLYAFVQPPLVWYSTAGVLVGDREVVVVDSLTNEAMARALLEEIRGVTDEPVRLLINTHSHADHIYTNHLFSPALVLGSARGRAQTREFQAQQAFHDEAFARLFPDVDFAGGRYTLQDVTFTGCLTLFQGERAIRVLELGPGHSESDVVVHLPVEGVVFCGDLFMNGLPPMPAEGRLSATLANMKALEALGASTFVAGHGSPGNAAEFAAQRGLLESLAEKARRCYDRGMNYDEALGAFADGPVPPEFARPTVLSGYCEWAGRMPESHSPGDVNHMAILGQVARRARAPGGRPDRLHPGHRLPRTPHAR